MPPPHHLREMRMLPIAERGRRARRCRPRRRRRARGACPQQYRGRSTAPRRQCNSTLVSSVPEPFTFSHCPLQRVLSAFFFHLEITTSRARYNTGTCSLRPPHTVPREPLCHVAPACDSGPIAARDIPLNGCARSHGQREQQLRRRRRCEQVCRGPRTAVPVHRRPFLGAPQVQDERAEENPKENRSRYVCLVCYHDYTLLHQFLVCMKTNLSCILFVREKPEFSSHQRGFSKKN